jgi:endonuclease YncB( thermonuclease family)
MAVTALMRLPTFLLAISIGTAGGLIAAHRTNVLPAASAGALVVTNDGLRLSDDATTSQAGSFPCSVVSIHDGDTLRCSDGTRVRLAGINAREVDGTCGPRPCPAASADAATAELNRLAYGQELTCQANGSSYGRTAAFCRVDRTGEDLSCAMVASGTAAIWPRYWQDHACV